MLGTIENNRMVLNDIGQMVSQHWQELSRKFSGMENHDFIVMPNHIHSIIQIMPSRCRGLINQTPTPEQIPATKYNNGIPLGEIIRQFKAKSTHIIRNISQIYQIWQRNYYEHIIRDAAELDVIKKYILKNPLQWKEDENNPEKTQGNTQQNHPPDR
jgi:REP element-mobilizing transposase RayT